MSNVQQMDMPMPTASLWRRGVRAARASHRTRLMMTLVGGVFLLFVIQRIVLAVFCWRDLADVAGGELAQAMGIALLYDMQVTAYLTALLIPLILLPPTELLTRRWLRGLLSAGVGLTLTLVFILVVIDAAFFMYHSGNRLNRDAAEYLRFFGPIAETIWESYPVIWLGLLVMLVLAGSWWGIRRVCFAGPGDAWPVRTRLIFLGVLAAVAAVCCRGGGRRGWILDDDLAYVSRNNAVCQLSLNPTVAFGSAVTRYYWPLGEEGKTGDDARPFVMPASEAFARVRQALAGGGVGFDDNETNPLWRTVRTGKPQRRPNVVVIVMEGFADRNIGVMGWPDSRTPEFDELAAEGTFFSNMYASGPRTSRGLAAVLCGLPDTGTRAPVTRPEMVGRAWTLGREFDRRDYETLFICGADLAFDNMGEFFHSNGFNRMIGIEQMPAEPWRRMPPEAWRTTWGMYDHLVFEEVDRRFADLFEQGKEFFAVVLTTTNHHPYAFPSDCIDDDVLSGEGEEVAQANSIRYADWAMGEFFRRARQQPYFDNTIFVLVADHGQRPFDSRLQVDVQRYALPCLIYAPNLPESVPPQRVDVLCSQTDIGPTLLGMLGGTFEHPMFGRDLLSLGPKDPGFALLRHQRRLACLRGDLILELTPGEHRFLYRRVPSANGNGGRVPLATLDFPEAVEEMDLLARAIHHAAEELVDEAAYRKPPARGEP